MKKTIVPLIFALALMAVPVASNAGVFVSINIAPPELPVYEQPEAPDDGYIWTPGYWAYGDEGYYWVPGTWVLAPEPGYLWTPAYWGWADGFYVFHPGYWGTRVGYYGGINYGYGYGGHGYDGGHWDHNHFFYNRAVNHIDTARFRNTYNRPVINNITENRISYNGGDGGTRAHPTHQQLQIEHQHHIQPTLVQTQHEQSARSNPAQFVNQNHGRPEVAATPHAGQFSGPGIVQPRGPSAFGQAASPKSGPQNEMRPAQNQPHAPAYSYQPQRGAAEHGQPQAVQPQIRREQLGTQQHPQLRAQPQQQPQQFRAQPQQQPQQFRAQPQQQPQFRAQPQQQPQQFRAQPQQQPQFRAQPQQQMQQQHQAPPRPQAFTPQQPRPQAIAPQPHEAPHPNGGGGGEHREPDHH